MSGTGASRTAIFDADLVSRYDTRTLLLYLCRVHEWTLVLTKEARQEALQIFGQMASLRDGSYETGLDDFVKASHSAGLLSVPDSDLISDYLDQNPYFGRQVVPDIWREAQGDEGDLFHVYAALATNTPYIFTGNVRMVNVEVFESLWEQWVRVPECPSIRQRDKVLETVLGTDHPDLIAERCLLARLANVNPDQIDPSDPERTYSAHTERFATNLSSSFPNTAKRILESANSIGHDQYAHLRSVLEPDPVVDQTMYPSGPER